MHLLHVLVTRLAEVERGYRLAAERRLNMKLTLAPLAQLMRNVRRAAVTGRCSHGLDARTSASQGDR